MEQDPVQIVNSFRETASRLFEELFHNFKEQTARLNRQTDENVFQQCLGRYERQLQQQLAKEAKELMHAYKRNDILHLQHLLTKAIAYYLLEFRTKAGST